MIHTEQVSSFRDHLAEIFKCALASVWKMEWVKTKTNQAATFGERFNDVVRFVAQSIMSKGWIRVADTNWARRKVNRFQR